MTRQAPLEATGNECTLSDRNPPWPPGPWPVADDDLNVLVEAREQPHQALHGEALQTKFRKRRDFRLVDAQQLRCLSLREPASVQDFVDRHSQTDLGLPFTGVRKAEVGEYIPRTPHNSSTVHPSFRISRTRHREEEIGRRATEEW